VNDSALLRRIVTASILIPLVVAGVLWLPTIYIALIFGAIVLLGGLEWTQLCAIRSPSGKALYLLLLLAALCGAWLLIGQQDLAIGFLQIVALLWLAAAVALFRLKKVERDLQGFHLMSAVIGFFVLIPVWAALIMVHAMDGSGPVWVLFLLILIWVADSGAYFTGVRWGRNKLAPVISPGKSWEGLYGALAGALLCAIGVFWFKEMDNLLLVILLCMVTVLASVVGDLFESLFKRRAGIKDSGNLLPGHGGVLDRIDSLTSAAPVYLLALEAIGA
jgi:phosphatidate cytidylyltransferase